MLPRIQIAVLVLVPLLLAGIAWAQPVGSYLTLTPTAGFPLLRGSQRFADLPLDHGTYLGGRIGYHWSERLGLELGADDASIWQLAGIVVDSLPPTPNSLVTPCPSCPADHEDASFVRGSVDILFAPYVTEHGSVYALVGVGASRLRSHDGRERIDQTNFEVGYGARFWFTDAVALGLEARHIYRAMGDGRSAWGAPSTLAGARITIAFGSRGSPASTPAPPLLTDAIPSLPIAKPIPAPDSCAAAIEQLSKELLASGTIVLQGFDAGGVEVRPESRSRLTSIGCWLLSLPDSVEVELGGYTEPRGWPAYDLRLSQDRADSVLAELRQSNPALKARKLVARGYGAAEAATVSESEADRAKNRKIVFRVATRPR